jgi:hypothetical protein
MAYVMFGNGVAGIGSNILRAISLAVWPASANEHNLFYGALFNFSVAVLFLIVCAFVAMQMDKNEYARYYIYDQKPPPMVQEIDAEDSN